MIRLFNRGVCAALIIGVLAAGALTACGHDVLGMRDSGPGSAGRPVPLVVDPTDPEDMDQALDRLAERRVILVGETHDRPDHHQNQLAVLRGLRERGLDLAIGMEFFQSPFQPHLDAYVAGEIDEKQLLKRTEYFNRWRFDYRLYRDILAYARAQRIPLVALNAPAELVARVSAGGLAALSPEERDGLTLDLGTADRAYEARLRPIFELHGTVDEARFQRFIDVQRLWDAHMAREASTFLAQNPAKRLVILAGSGHVVHGNAIPGRLTGPDRNEVAILATGPRERYSESRPDLLFVERDLPLEPAGRMGMALVQSQDGVRVRRVQPKSPAEKAGFRTGDRILEVGGEPVHRLEDLRIALLDRAPGDALRVVALRPVGPHKPRRIAAPVTLL